jgi:dCTP deaminase
MSDLETLAAIDDGRVIIWPFDRQSLNTSSYDIRLGEFYYEEHRPSLATRARALLTPKRAMVFNPYDKEHVDRVWGKDEDFLRAKPAKEVLRSYISSDWMGIEQRDLLTTGIHPDDLIILVGPRRTILAHSQEFIGGVRYATSMMKARSSWGRSFVEVCKCAGWGDIGFFNRWTMEITNNSYWYSIPLVVGRRIAQIALLTTGEIQGDSYSTEQSKYQTSEKLDDVITTWHPRLLKPGLWRDRDIVRMPAMPEQLPLAA